MNDNEFKDFLAAQRREILQHKYIESEKAGKDLGNDAVADWIDKYGQSFRDKWECKGS